MGTDNSRTMSKAVLLGLICVAVAASAQLPTAAQTARGMVSAIQWGALVTTSTRNQSEGSQPGDAFGNPNSLADVAGVPYIYASALDASFVDIAAGETRISFALTEAALQNSDGSANVTSCKIGAGLGDPENPPCARLILSGVVSKVSEGTDEEKQAQSALFARHPSFKNYPSGHDFFIAKLTVDHVWLISAYGGALSVKPADYFGATPSLAGLSLTEAGMDSELSGPPLPFFKVSMARWMAKYLTYGVLSTISTRSYGTTVGAPFGNPYSFADVDGALYMYACDLDASMIDVFTGNGTAPPNPRATLALSQAAYPDKILSNCKIGGFLGDPENPLCARLVFSGAVSKVAFGSDEETNAKAALFARHPSFKQFPAGHSFYVTKLAIDGIWLIDIFGGAAVISPSDYFKG